MGSHKVIWTIKELTKVLRERQLNKFDCNYGVSGKRGDGKSTILYKIFNSFKKQGFIPKKHQVYSQRDVMDLLSKQKFNFCWDDEAINSGFKRNFATVGQKTLIQLITNYRDNFNIYGSALPFFYSLDKALRELMFMHIHIIERGVAVILLPVSDQIHSQDPWDTKANIRIEENEYKLMKKNPQHKFRYHKLTTFAGFIYFGPMTKKQEERYVEIKKDKRKKHFEGQAELGEEGNQTFTEKLYDLLIDMKLTKEGLMQTCLIEDRKYSSICQLLNKMLTDKGVTETLGHYLKSSQETVKKVEAKEKRAEYLRVYNRKRWLRMKEENKQQKILEEKPEAKEKAITEKNIKQEPLKEI